MDYAGGGRWDRLLSDGPADSADGHAYTIILDAQDQANTHIDNVVARLVGSEPDFYNQHNLQAANQTRGGSVQKAAQHCVIRSPRTRTPTVPHAFGTSSRP